jgi:hypothetical protein
MTIDCINGSGRRQRVITLKTKKYSILETTTTPTEAIDRSLLTADLRAAADYFFL